MNPVSASDICRPASAYCPKERIKSERVRFFTAAEGGPQSYLSLFSTDLISTQFYLGSVQPTVFFGRTS